MVLLIVSKEWDRITESTNIVYIVLNKLYQSYTQVIPEYNLFYKINNIIYPRLSEIIK